MEGTIDLTKYPEGFDAVIKSLTFLPDDYDTRVNYMMGLAFTLLLA